MKVFLDDLREAPPGWTQVRWPSEAIALLETGLVSHLALDHDLGDAETADHEGRAERTGYQVLVWLQEKVYFDPDFPVPEITIHTDNASAYAAMQQAVEWIEEHRK